MAPTLAELPNEVLIQIGERTSWADGRERDFLDVPDEFFPYARPLGALARVNKHFHTIFRPLLYQVHDDRLTLNTRKYLEFARNSKWDDLLKRLVDDEIWYEDKRLLKSEPWPTLLEQYHKLNPGKRDKLLKMLKSRARAYNSGKHFCPCVEAGLPVYPLHVALYHTGGSDDAANRLVEDGACLVAKDKYALDVAIEDFFSRSTMDDLEETTLRHAATHGHLAVLGRVLRKLRQRPYHACSRCGSKRCDGSVSGYESYLSRTRGGTDMCGVDMYHTDMLGGAMYVAYRSIGDNSIRLMRGPGMYGTGMYGTGMHGKVWDPLEIVRDDYPPPFMFRQQSEKCPVERPRSLGDTDSLGRNCFHLACMHGHVKIVKRLLQLNKAGWITRHSRFRVQMFDVEAEDVNHRTAFDLATEAGHTKVRRLLLAHGIGNATGENRRGERYYRRIERGVSEISRLLMENPESAGLSSEEKSKLLVARGFRKAVAKRTCSVTSSHTFTKDISEAIKLHIDDPKSLDYRVSEFYDVLFACGTIKEKRRDEPYRGDFECGFAELIKLYQENCEIVDPGPGNEDDITRCLAPSPRDHTWQADARAEEKRLSSLWYKQFDSLYDIAAVQQNTQAAWKLLSFGADPSRRELEHGAGPAIRHWVSFEAETPCAKYHQGQIVKELIAKDLTDIGDDLGIPDDCSCDTMEHDSLTKESMLFQAAAIAKNSACVRYLLEDGARADQPSINLADTFSDIKPGDEQSLLMGLFRTVWHGAFERYEEVDITPVREVIRLLVEHGARGDPCGPGLSALEWACRLAEKGHHKVLDLLIHSGISKTTSEEYAESLMDEYLGGGSDDMTADEARNREEIGLKLGSVSNLWVLGDGEMDSIHEFVGRFNVDEIVDDGDEEADYNDDDDSEGDDDPTRISDDSEESEDEDETDQAR